MDRSKNFSKFAFFAAGRLRVCVDFWGGEDKGSKEKDGGEGL